MINSEEKTEYKAESEYTANTADRISCSKDIYKAVKGSFPEHQEQMHVLYLDNKNVPLKHEIVSTGTVNECLVNPCDVLRPAINIPGVCSIVMIHNHPSGDPTPSPADNALTRKMQKCCETFNLRLLDHIIVGDGYLSLRDLGIL